jgi:acetolactate synthase-1/3 small subunit
MVVKEEESVISQILKQLNKVIDVVEVQNLSDVESVSLEIAIVKLKLLRKKHQKLLKVLFPLLEKLLIIKMNL